GRRRCFLELRRRRRGHFWPRRRTRNLFGRTMESVQSQVELSKPDEPDQSEPTNPSNVLVEAGTWKSQAVPYALVQSASDEQEEESEVRSEGEPLVLKEFESQSNMVLVLDNESRDGTT